MIQNLACIQTGQPNLSGIYMQSAGSGFNCLLKKASPTRGLAFCPKRIATSAVSKAARTREVSEDKFSPNDLPTRP